MPNLINKLNKKLADANSIYRLAKANGQCNLIDIKGGLVQAGIEMAEAAQYIDELIYDEFN